MFGRPFCVQKLHSYFRFIFVWSKTPEFLSPQQKQTLTISPLLCTCRDINECAKEETCKTNHVCTNTPGGHRCNQCNQACNGCTAIGAKRCIECADGYHRPTEDDNECIKIEEEKQESDETKESDDDEAQGGGNSPGHDEL